METWEVVLVLVLVTVAVSVLSRNDISLSMIRTLDNTFFQLAILGLTLGAATVSPSVAIVAVATIAVVYYVRNLAKINMVRGADAPEEVAAVVVVETESQPAPVSLGTLPQVNAPPPPDNSDVLETAFKEHESRPPISQLNASRNTTMGGTAMILDQPPPARENFENPRTMEGFTASALDKQADFNGDAPPQVWSTIGAGGAVDSDIFIPGTSGADGYNEGTSAPPVRSYNDNQGQYELGAVRPHTKPGKYEMADFTPGSDVGSNEFVQVGASIDDKITNLRTGSSSVVDAAYTTVTPPYA
jgi:hypothetical protein